MSFNTNGLQTMMDEIYTSYTYIAYGSGTVADNDTFLDTEIDRAARVEATRYNQFFECVYVIPSTDSNGEVITEWGLARADVGDIDSSFNNYPMEKTASYEILIIARVFMSVI
jgi:hypothetical protein